MNISCHKSSISKLVPAEISKWFSGAEKAKLLFRHICGGYVVYVAAMNDEPCGYLFLKRNYLGKYSFMAHGDMLVNPVYTRQQFRDCGVATALLEQTRKSGARQIYAVIKADNLSSRKAHEKAGFACAGYSKKSFWSHKLSDTPTNLLVYKTDTQVC